MADADARAAVGFCFELGRLRRGEEMGVEKTRTDERLEFSEGGVRRKIFRDVARRVAVNECEMRAGLERDRADENILERGVGAAVFAESEFHERAVADGGVKQTEEAFARSWFHFCHSERSEESSERLRLSIDARVLVDSSLRSE